MPARYPDPRRGERRSCRARRDRTQARHRSGRRHRGATASCATPRSRAARRARRAHGARRQHLFRHAGLAPCRCGHRRCGSGATATAGCKRSRARRSRRPGAHCTRAASTNGRCARPRLDTVRLATTPWRRLLARCARGRPRTALHDRLRAQDARRSAFPTVRGAELCLDLGVIRARTTRGRRRARRVPISEIEIELESGDTARPVRARRRAGRDLPIAVAHGQQGGARAARWCRARPTDRHKPVRARRDRAAEGRPAPRTRCARIVRECLHQSRPTPPDSLADDDPEWVHQIRIGTRRLRACLATRRAVSFPRTVVEPLLAEIKWLAGVLGACP